MMNGRNIRRGISLLSAVLLLTSLCACGSDAGDDAIREEELLNQTPVTIHVYNTLSASNSMENIEAYIRRTMPNVTIESSFENGAKVENAQLGALRNGGGPEILYTQDYYSYVQNGYLVDLTSEKFLKNYMISALNDIDIGGKVYALPIGNGSVSGLLVNLRLLRELGYKQPETQDEFIELCRGIQARKEATGVRAYAFSMLYDDSAATISLPFMLDAYTDSAYAQWLTNYRSAPSAVSFNDPAFINVLEKFDVITDLGLIEGKDYLTNATHNMGEVLNGNAVMCSLTYESYLNNIVDKVVDVDGVPTIEFKGNNVEANEPAADFAFIPYMGETPDDRWLATNGDWYLGINANVTDEATLKACRLFLEYIASTKFAPEIYSGSVPAGATTYYRRDDSLQYDDFKDAYPEIYKCLTENSIVKNPYQFYGSNVFTFAMRHYLCGQEYYVGLEGADLFMPIGDISDILSALEGYRTTGVSRYEVPDNLVGETDKDYNYSRIHSRSNESALGNLLADAMREYTGADLAVINAGSLTASIEAGEITESDLATAMLYGLSNHIVTVRCKGENLISILSENTVANLLHGDGTSVFGGLVIPSGFTYKMTYTPVTEPENCFQAQISDVRLLNGESIDPEAYYTVTTTDYELGGTDRWLSFTLIPQDKPEALIEGIELYSSFNSVDEAACLVFDLVLENYTEQYGHIIAWAQARPNIIDAVIKYIERHSENGILDQVGLDGRIAIINLPACLDPVLNGVDLG